MTAPVRSTPGLDCGTGIWRDRDIAAGWRYLETPSASLPTRSPCQRRTAARKAGVLDPRKQLRERDRRSAGGEWIRTLSSTIPRDRRQRRHPYSAVSGGSLSCRDSSINLPRPTTAQMTRRADGRSAQLGRSLKTAACPAQAALSSMIFL
jgi:hypothetical protein